MTAPARSRAVPRTPVRAVPATRPFLRLVPQARSTAARAPFAAVVVALLGLGLLGLLGLNTVLAEGAFRLHSLEQQARDLAVREQVLQRQVETLRAPGSLASRAAALGMVPGGPPVHLRLSDGAILGVPVPGRAPAPKVVARKPAVVPVVRPGTAPTAGPTAAPAQGSTTWTAPKRPTPAPRATGAAR